MPGEDSFLESPLGPSWHLVRPASCRPSTAVPKAPTNPRTCSHRPCPDCRGYRSVGPQNATNVDSPTNAGVAIPISIFCEFVNVSDFQCPREIERIASVIDRPTGRSGQPEFVCRRARPQIPAVSFPAVMKWHSDSWTTSH